MISSAPSGNVCPVGQRCLILAMRQVGDAWRATPKGRRIALWVARGQAGPTAPLVVEVAASVTPCRQDAGPTVLDEHRHVRARRSAASLRGDVVGTDQIPVPLEGAMGTAEPPALGLGDPPPAGGQLEEVPRSSTSRTTIPACSALSRKAWSRWVRRHSRNRRFCTRPASWLVMPLRSPTTRVPTWWWTAKAITCLAA